MRGHGDMMGVAGRLNDGADITDKVTSFWPNDFGLYHMAGNVSEWVMDVYRPMTSEVAEEFMPFRGNKYQTQLMVPNGLHDRPVKANENIYDVHGMKEFVNEFARVKYLAYANKDYNTTQNASQNGFSGNIPDQKKIDQTTNALIKQAKEDLVNFEIALRDTKQHGTYGNKTAAVVKTCKFILTEMLMPKETRITLLNTDPKLVDQQFVTAIITTK
jgi:hypothetical protein